MAERDAKEVFVILLSDLRRGAEHGEKIYQELGQVVQDTDIKEALEARAFVSKDVIAKLDQCFTLIGEKPVQLSGKYRDMLLEDWRKELGEIKSPVGRRLFVLAKLVHLAHMRIGEYMVLIAAADAAGYHGAGVLLESALAEKLALVERVRRLIRERRRES
jgi:ferritin-like metal-binding protein YciE